MIYNFDELPPRRETDSFKWRTYDPDVLPLWVADMDFKSPEPVIRALRQRVEHGVFGYPNALYGKPEEATEMRQVILERLERLYDWRIAPEDIVFLPGVATGFFLACHALATPEGGVLVQPPVYPPILMAPKLAGMARQEAELHLDGEGGYYIDEQAFETAITDQTRLFILCNPHNPVGRVFRREELESMAAACLRRGVVICSDEIHCDLVYDGRRHVPLASLDPEIAHNTITLMAPSKTFNMPGLKFSFAIIQNAELRKKYQHTAAGLVGWINVMGWTAAMAAYREGQEWYEQLMSYLTANRDYLYDYVRNELPDIQMVRPEGTYLAWLDCRQASIDGNPYEFFLEKARVAFNDGAAFGSAGEGFVRLNFGCPRAILAEALDRVKQALPS